MEAGLTGAAAGWNQQAADYYMACTQQGGTAAACETATNNYMAGAGSGWMNTTSGIIDLLGDLGTTGAGLYYQFAGNQPPQFQQLPPEPQQQNNNNTVFYIVIGFLALLIIFLMMKK